MRSSNPGEGYPQIRPPSPMDQMRRQQQDDDDDDDDQE
jgi:hypothetical protein